MLILSVIANIVLIGYIHFLNKEKNEVQKKYEADEVNLLECENMIRIKNKIISDLKKEKQALYKTIDEFTSEKELPVDVEVAEKSLKKKRK